jgi:hypothetical protein
MFGKLLALPVRILNIPARAMEKLVGDQEKEDRVISKPLELLAEAIEESLDGEK